MDYMTIKEAADRWGITICCVQALRDSRQIGSATRFGQIWVIPKGTPKPTDGRTKAARRKKVGGG